MITQERLRELLSYDPETGVLHWRTRVGKRSAGAAAGCLDNRGYQVVNIGGKRYYAHRIAWLYTHGKFPVGIIDHVNGQKSDNSIKNLRDVSSQINNQNHKKANKTNKSTGVLGVRKNKNKYLAQITINNKEIHLGTFDTVDAAHTAYLEAKRRFHIGCTI